MNLRNMIATVVASSFVLVASGCAVQRGQQSPGAYVDDAAITTSLKSRYVGKKEVDASSISVETLNGVVMLSGFAKDSTEKAAAESMAWKIAGVKSVKNEIIVRP
jgi:hyperosmotically inducible periplasmic protein